MFCTKCGAQHPDDTNFCTLCGNKMRDVPAAPVAEDVVTEAAPAVEMTPEAASEPISQPVAEEITEAIPDPEPVAEPAPEPAPEAAGDAPEVVPEAVPEEAADAVPEAAPEEAAEDAPAAAEDQVPPAVPAVCQKCGAPLESGSNFCLNCGTYQDEAVPEKEKKGGKKPIIIIAAAMVALVLVLVGGYFIIKEVGYNSAMTLIEEQDYDAAIEKLEGLNGYKDSEEVAADLYESAENYGEAMILLDSGDLDGAAKLLKKLDGYADAEEVLENITAYQEAAGLVAACDYEGAKAAFAALGNFADSADMAAYGVDYANAMALMASAAEEGTQTPLETRANVYLDAAAILQGMDYSDAAAQANECLYQASVLLMEAGDFDSALALRELMDDATAQRYDTTYQSFCADNTLWDEILASAELVSRDGTEAEYRASIEARIAYLKPLLDAHYENVGLKALLEAFVKGLETELALMDEEGVVTNWPDNYKVYSLQYAALADIAAVLELDEETVTELENLENLNIVLSELEKMLTAQFTEAPKSDGTGDYTDYYVIENTSAYGFTLVYTIDWFSGDTYVASDEVKSIEVAAGASVEVPLIIPADSDADNYTLYWEVQNISLDGTLLPGQE